MSVKYLDPSNPSASTQAQRDAAATANWNAIKAAAGQVNTTTSPVSLGLGGNQGIVRLKPGIWWLSSTLLLNTAFNNVRIHPAPGATIWASDTKPGETFTWDGGVANCSIKGGPWADDGTNGAAPATMTNKTGGGFPTISSGLGGGQAGGPSVTATGDPRVPWDQPVSEMFSVMVDKDESSWIADHRGFVLAQKCTNCELDRVFYFGYVNASSGGMAMLVPRADAAAGGGLNGSGAASPHNLHQTNNFMINAPQGFGLNQWTDCRGFFVDNNYCCGGEAQRMETHKPNDGGIHDGSGGRIAQSGGNVGVAFTPHDAKNGVVQLSCIWSHSSESGAVKVRQGRTGAKGTFAAGSYCRDVTVIGSDKTWAQLQGDDNTPTTPDTALRLDAPDSWVGNVAFTGKIAFGHMDNIGPNGGIPVNTTPNAVDGFNRANASFGIKATTRDLTGPCADGTSSPDTIAASGALTLSGALAILALSTPTTHPKSVAGSMTPTGKLTITKAATPVARPTLVSVPPSISTSGVAFVRARNPTGTAVDWFWVVDGEDLPPAFGLAEDARSFEVDRGLHEVSVSYRTSGGQQSPPSAWAWNVTDIIISQPGPGDLLGCGVYSVGLKLRGGGRPYAYLPWTSLAWERKADDTGEASVVIDGVSAYGADCCQLLGDVLPWVQELTLYRDDDAVWEGPIISTLINPDNDQATLTARDLSVWLDHRRIHQAHAYTQTELTDIWLDYATDAMQPDLSPQLAFIVRNPSGVLGDRTAEANRLMAGNELRELARSGVHWSVLLRSLYLGYPADPSPLPTLTDAHFVSAPSRTDDGLAAANDWVVLGEGTGEGAPVPYGAAQDADSRDLYGLLEAVESENEIQDDTSAAAAAASRLVYSKVPPVAIEGGTLDQKAPVTIDRLIPGAKVKVAIQESCKPFLDTYRLTSIKGTASPGVEAVTIQWEPVG